MEKKISGVKPKKTYVLRFRPAGGAQWSKNFEFTAPTPTPGAIAAAVDGKQSSKIITTVKMTSNKDFAGEVVCSWDAAVNNDYGMWTSTFPENQKIYCIADGWYEASAQSTFDTFTYGSFDFAATYIDYTNVGLSTTTRLAGQATQLTYGNSYYISQQTKTSLTYCKAGDYFRTYVSTGSGGGSARLVPIYSTVTPITQMSVTYLGP